MIFRYENFVIAIDSCVYRRRMKCEEILNIFFDRGIVLILKIVRGYKCYFVSNMIVDFIELGIWVFNF